MTVICRKTVLCLKYAITKITMALLGRNMLRSSLNKTLFYHKFNLCLCSFFVRD
jgi:hypothetical protein